MTTELPNFSVRVDAEAFAGQHSHHFLLARTTSGKTFPIGKLSDHVIALTVGKSKIVELLLSPRFAEHLPVESPLISEQTRAGVARALEAWRTNKTIH